MRKILLTIFILFVAMLLKLNATNITTIDFIKNNAKDNDFFTIHGVLTERVSDDKYIFQDSTGTAKVEVEKSALREKGINSLPLNTNITLKISIDKEFAEKMEFEVFEIVDIATSNNKPNFYITDINFINKNAKDNDAFTIEGTIIQRTSTDKYEFKDSSGNAIIEVKKSAFRNANIQKFNDGDTVILKVKIDKEFAEKMEIEAFEIIKHNGKFINQ
ncbi:MAG: NirD/YgiW/YdeI family stress tolerance protein [Alphaproteobacteria bacterium]|jgi:uncharacterized protein (TIGR00156 family)|nr:NirD/YgiW/YdeI family stress tolerance protein [Alphaproteobacteria bacterium]